MMREYYNGEYITKVHLNLHIKGYNKAKVENNASLVRNAVSYYQAAFETFQKGKLKN